MSRPTESATLKSIIFFYLVTFYHVRFCNCLVLCLYFNISLRSKWDLFQTLKEHYLMHKSIQNPLFRQLAFTRSNYVRGLNYRERYHTRELMSFHFIFVTNFIRDKNPLYGMKYGLTSCPYAGMKYGLTSCPYAGMKYEVWTNLTNQLCLCWYKV